MNRLRHVSFFLGVPAAGTVRCWSGVLPFMLALLLVAPARAENEGLEDLDQATQAKVTAKNMRDLEKVAQLCESAIEKGLEEGHREFAFQLLTATLYERAQRWTESVMEGNPRENWRQLRRMACRDLRRAIRHDETHGEAHLLLARLQLLPDGDASEGKSSVIRAVELLQESPDRHSAALVVRSGYRSDPEQRLRDLDRAIELNSKNLDAWRERGGVKLAMGNTDTAIEDFLHLLETDQDDVAAMQAVAQAFASQEKYDEALEYLNKAIEKDADAASAYTIRARIYLLQDKTDEALEDLSLAINKRPRDLSALLTRARIRHVTGDASGALSDIQRALQIRPGLVQAVLLRSMVYASDGRYREAAVDLSQLLRLDKQNVILRLQLATIYVMDKSPRKAIEVYDEVLAIDDQQVEAIRGRADALLSLGQHAEAIAGYERAIKTKPSDEGVLNNLAWVLATSPLDGLRDAERSIELATQACEATEYKAPHVLSTLAAGYAEKGDFENAIKWSTKAVELGDGDVKQQLAEELESYKQGEPWREMQEVIKEDETRDDDLDVDPIDDSEAKQESSEASRESDSGGGEGEVPADSDGEPEKSESDESSDSDEATPEN